jgi:hypothetical protein
LGEVKKRIKTDKLSRPWLHFSGRLLRLKSVDSGGHVIVELVRPIEWNVPERPSNDNVMLSLCCINGFPRRLSRPGFARIHYFLRAYCTIPDIHAFLARARSASRLICQLRFPSMQAFAAARRLFQPRLGTFSLTGTVSTPHSRPGLISMLIACLASHHSHDAYPVDSYV